MLGRAVNATEASKPPPNLAKELFPSSSPVPTRNADIAQQFKKPYYRVGSLGRPSPATSKPSMHAVPLQPRSANASLPAKHGSLNQQSYPSGKGRSLASLYNKQDSFTEKPEIIDLCQDSPGQKREKASINVYFAEDDFSDDDDLDLDFERPSTLPSLPPQETPAKRHDEPPLPSEASFLSWSQSSPSHLQPSHSTLPSQTTSQMHNTQHTLEPTLPDGSHAAVKASKKRTLPKQYPHSKQADEALDHIHDDHSVKTPGPEIREKSETPFWDATPSAVKAHKKQLKGQSKRPATYGTEASAEEQQQAIKSHAALQTVISLSSEQDHVKKLVCEKNCSVFFTGPAGTGKSVLMRAIIQDLKKKYFSQPERLAVTASTGLAACNIGGMTLHSFSGIGLGKDDAQTLIRKIRRNPKAKSRWLKTKTLIIDEVSMVDGELFDKLSQIGRIIRNNGRPWGGIQLVITGDFFQLPPVPDGQDKKRDVKFAFEAATWNTSIDHTIGLTEVFRQKDPVFAGMLNEMRLGQISNQTVSAFKSLSRPLHFADGLGVTELFPTRYEVDHSNQKRLRELPGKAHRYESRDTGDPAVRDKLLVNMMAPKVLELKKGAQVMLIKNIDEGLVNGSLGTVIGFSTEDMFEITGGMDGDPGSDDEVDPKVKQRMAKFARDLRSDKPEYPLVQFHAVDGQSRIILCIPEPWKVELPTGEVQACREQLPLILAWALSIHKAQGQTLERVKVDLGKVFEKGQAYVALSRATTQHGLQVLRFDQKKVMAHPRVVDFYQKLYTVETAMKRKAPASIRSFAFTRDSDRPAKKLKPPGALSFDDDEKPLESLASFG